MSTPGVALEERPHSLVPAKDVLLLEEAGSGACGWTDTLGTVTPAKASLESTTIPQDQPGALWWVNPSLILLWRALAVPLPAEVAQTLLSHGILLRTYCQVQATLQYKYLGSARAKIYGYCAETKS